MRFGRPLLLVVSMGVLLGACNSKGSGNGETAPGPAKPVPQERIVDVTEVSPRAIPYTVTAVGSLKAPEHVTLSPKKAGIIRSLFVKEGDRVRKGQLLVQLDDTDSRLKVTREEAKVREAEASLENNRTTLERYQTLLEKKYISQQNYDDLMLKVKVDEARLALARSELDLVRQEVLDHRLVSPVDGVVNVKIASLGEHVNVAPKDEILTIVQMDPLELEFYVPELWAGKIRPGSKVQVTLKAFSEKTFSATMTFISPTADPSTRNVRMKAIVANPQYQLKPGYFAEVRVPTGGNPQALMIPESALLSQEGRYALYVVEHGIARRRDVETGLRMEGRVEILKGLLQGDRVVTAGQEQLMDGMTVKVRVLSESSPPRS